MNCAELQNLLVQYLLNELSDEEHAAVESHLQNGCPACVQEIHELSESMHIVWSALPDRPLPDSLRSHVLEVCLNPNKPTSFKEARHSAVSSEPVKHPILWREALLALAAGILLMATWRIVFPGTSFGKTSSATVVGRTQPLADQLRMQPPPPASFSRAAEKINQPLLVSLHSSSEVGDLKGQALWDRVNREIHFYCFGLTPTGPGKRYGLYLLSPNRAVQLSAELQVDSRGECRAVVTCPTDDIQYIQIMSVPIDNSNQSPVPEVVLTSDAIQLR